MTKTTRYQVKDVISKRGKCRTHTGVDPVTGLPVLIYIFEGRPRVTVGRLEADTIASILAARFNGEKNKGQVVVAHSEERQQLERVANQDEARLLLLDTVKALAAAAAVKVVHGDIHPGRFWVEAGRYWLEGYGVNWRGQDERFSPPERSVSLQGDVFSWAQSVYDIAGHAMSRAMTKLVATCLADDPEQRPSAAALLEQLTALANEPTHNPTATNPTANPTAANPTANNTQPAEPATVSRAGDDFNFNFQDVDFQDDDTTTFAPPAPTQTETHAPTESAARLADFDLGGFAADDDDDDDDVAMTPSHPASDYDLFGDDSDDDDSDEDSFSARASSDSFDAAGEPDFEPDFGDAPDDNTHASNTRNASFAAEDDFAEDDFAEDDFGDGDFTDHDPTERALVSREPAFDGATLDDEPAFAADSFAGDGGFAEAADENDFDSFDDDFTEPDAPNDSATRNSASSGGLSDLSEIMSPAYDPRSADTPASEPIVKANQGEFIKGLPTGATVRTVESKKKNTSSELPPSQQPKVYTPPKKRKKKRLGRQLGIVALIVSCGVLVYIALDRYGVLEPPRPPGPVATFFPLTVSVRPDSIAQAQLVVVSSPAGSVHEPGDEMATVPARIFLDSEGTWQLRARFQNVLSDVQTLTIPGPNAVTFEIPIPEEDLELPPN